MKNLVYIQSIIASYREPVIAALAKKFRLTIIADLNPNANLGYSQRKPLPVYKAIQAKRIPLFGGRLLFQPCVALMSFRKVDGILIDANVRLISLWAILLRCRLSGIKLYAHGQGSYRYPHPNLVRRAIYRLLVKLSTLYICYNDAARKSLIDIGCPPKKLAIANNSLTLSTVVFPHEKTGTEAGILFVGRLRERCQLDFLLNAISALRSNGHDVTAHIIGTGEMEGMYRKQYSDRDWINWYGNVFDDSKIAAISRLCRIGCYPGDAGLSVVHCLGLSLPPVVHEKMHKHMGPEPHYVQAGVNGFQFAIGALAEKLEEIWLMPSHEICKISASAYKTYQVLNTPSLGDRISEIIDQSLDGKFTEE
ncbi:glycosyltransferase [Thalassospira xiamenensis]|uniref:glycosyltransferase n=1 Tax=Thalassospira xiamenensis TaxID=220697 RepID=UPI0015F0F3F2|nr:glycosyltransferase [Thalassospira xiamenensis]